MTPRAAADLLAQAVAALGRAKDRATDPTVAALMESALDAAHYALETCEDAAIRLATEP